MDDKTLGLEPCNISLVQILNETNCKKTSSIVTSRWHEARTGITKISKHFSVSDYPFFVFMLQLFREKQLKEVESIRDKIPNDVYTHLRCCLVAMFREALRNKNAKNSSDR